MPRAPGPSWSRRSRAAEGGGLGSVRYCWVLGTGPNSRRYQAAPSPNRGPNPGPRPRSQPRQLGTGCRSQAGTSRAWEVPPVPSFSGGIKHPSITSGTEYTANQVHLCCWGSVSTLFVSRGSKNTILGSTNAPPPKKLFYLAVLMLGLHFYLRAVKSKRDNGGAFKRSRGGTAARISAFLRDMRRMPASGKIRPFSSEGGRFWGIINRRWHVGRATARRDTAELRPGGRSHGAGRLGGRRLFGPSADHFDEPAAVNLEPTQGPLEPKHLKLQSGAIFFLRPVESHTFRSLFG